MELVGAPVNKYDEVKHVVIVGARRALCQPVHWHTAPFAADPTSFVYFASTPVV
jgi:hypothetical protein